MSVWIKLTPEEEAIAIRIASARNSTHAGGKASRTHSEKEISGEDTHLIGIRGEIAVARWFNVPFDNQIADFVGPSHDLVIPNLGRVNVKTSSYHYKGFTYRAFDVHNLDVDGFIWCINDFDQGGDPSFIEIYGWYPSRLAYTDNSRLLINTQDGIKIHPREICMKHGWPIVGEKKR